MCLLIFLGLAYGETSLEIIEQFEHGRINWSMRIVEAAGVGVVSSEVSNVQEVRTKGMINARQEAYVNLLEIIKKIQVTATQTLGEMVEKKDTILPGLETLLHNAPVFETDYLTDGSVAIKVRLGLDGELAQLILPDEITQLESINIGNEQHKAGQEAVYTGMIVDVRGLAFKPAMSFKMVDEGGQEVYGPKYVTRECAVRWGFCEYTDQINSVKTFKRLGNNPLIVKGIRLKTPGASTIVISDTDVSRIRSRVDYLTILKECRVAIVMDGISGKPESKKQ
ncbi:MAG: hypothetical protein ACKVE4_02440 [Dissulfuribacterales bacterium]